MVSEVAVGRVAEPARMMGSAIVDPFDATRASAPTVIVPLDRVVDLLGAEPHAPERTAAYRAAMLSGAQFPPISVVTWGARFLVADGHKRLAAYAALGPQHIRVEVWSWRRWARDQARQLKHNTRKNGQVLSLCLTDPRAAGALLATTMRHWRRVARSLAKGVRGRG
jgi:hypothetical protein